MLKITPSTTQDSTRLTLEGRLAGPWVEELERVWREIKDSVKDSLVVDLTGVTFIEQDGKTLLTRMWQQGARLHAIGCLNRCVVEEIAKAGHAGSTYSSRKGKREES